MTEKLTKEEELAQREEALNKMEEDIQKKCADLDITEASLEEREKELNRTLGLTKDADLFSNFYENVNQLYTLWWSCKGSAEGLIEAVQMILNARQSIQKNDS